MRPTTSRLLLLNATTENCLADFAQRFPDDAARTLLVEFIGVDERKTARAWLQGNRMPAGDELIRLRCFLDLVGYRVEEFFQLPEVTRQLARLIAYNILKLDAVRSTLGYRNIQDIYRVILRGSGVMPDKVHRLERLVVTNVAQLEREQVTWRERVNEVLFSDQMDTSATAPGTSESVKTSTAPSPDVLLAQALTNAMRTTQALCEAATTSHHPSLRSIRHAVSPDEVRRLIDALERLL